MNRGHPTDFRLFLIPRKEVKITCGQGARKSAAKTALFRAPLALTVSIDLSASGGEQGEVRVGPQGVPLP